MAVPRVYVYFDKLLQERELLEGAWSLRTSNWRRLLTNAVSIGNYVRIDTGPNFVQFGPNRVAYAPINPDLRDIDGLLVEPFVFPVTIIPP